MRTSSINAQTNYSDKSVSRMSSRDALRPSDRGRKPDATSPNRRGAPSINSVLEPTDERDRFFHARLPESESASFHELRVRASSPLLGQAYRANPSSFTVRQPEMPSIRKTGSWSDLHSDPHARRYALDTQSQRNLAYSDVEGLKGIGFPPSRSPEADERTQKVDAPPKTAKPKKRPSRIDLSLLFPKPKPQAVPLLSPQRYTDSPSPVASDYSFSQTKALKKLSKSPSRPRSNSRKQKDARIPEDGPLPPMPTTQRTLDWFDLPMEKAMRYDDTEAETISRIGTTNPPATTGSPLPSEPQDSRSTPDTSFRPVAYGTSAGGLSSKRVPSATSSTSRTPNAHLNPRAAAPFSSRLHPSLQPWQSDTPTGKARKTLAKKASSSTLMTSDLTTSSVLCLSSSEDEEEEDEDYGEQLMQRAAPRKTLRDSVATYDEFEPEILTAEAVVATKGLALTHVDRTHSVSSSGSRYSSRNRSRSRNASLSSSAGKSSRSGRKRESNISSHIPLIEEPDEFDEEPTPRQSLYSNPHSIKRRSRIIAVTRQEESLLEAMRLRNGRVTPSLFQDLRNPPADSDVEPALLSPPLQQSFESTQNVDTSFLRLSAAISAPLGMAIAANQGAASKENETYMSLGPPSDSEQRTDKSNASPRMSLVYSESHSSPSSTGLASPLTPTLPIHRISPRAPPPSYAPPPIPPEASRRHSRRRTDSSEAIILPEAEETKEPEPEYPLWAVKWSRDTADLAIVH
jgi:hypothetical protein